MPLGVEGGPWLTVRKKMGTLGIKLEKKKVIKTLIELGSRYFPLVKPPEENVPQSIHGLRPLTENPPKMSPD